jgi:hypothetical protein
LFKKNGQGNKLYSYHLLPFGDGGWLIPAINMVILVIMILNFTTCLLVEIEATGMGR